MLIPLLPKYLEVAYHYIMYAWCRYCTWNAFYGELKAHRIVKELESFRDAGVPARTLIIDDGWQDTVNPFQLAREARLKNASLATHIYDNVGFVIVQYASKIADW